MFQPFCLFQRHDTLEGKTKKKRRTRIYVCISQFYCLFFSSKFFAKQKSSFFFLFVSNFPSQVRLWHHTCNSCCVFLSSHYSSVRRHKYTVLVFVSFLFSLYCYSSISVQPLLFSYGELFVQLTFLISIVYLVVFLY